MKKLIVLFVSGLLLLTFGAGAFAQDKLEFRASGFMEATSFLLRNIPHVGQPRGAILTYWPKVSGADPWGAYDTTQSYWQYRAYLRFDAVYGKALSGTFLFELDSNRWGDIAGDRNTMGYWTADRAAVEVKNVYFDVALPYLGIPVPMSARVGLQPLVVRPKMVVTTDGMGISGGIKIDPVSIMPLYFKALEGRDASSDDVDVYGLHANAKVGTFTIGGYGLYYNMNTYPLSSVTTYYGVTVASFDANFWWLGFYADGKLGPVNLNFDFVYDRGKVEARDSGPARGARDVKYRGWATMLKIDYPWDKFNFGGVFMYASGSDARKTDANGAPGSPVADPYYGTTLGVRSTKVGSYVTPPGSEQWAAFQESIVFYAPQMSASATPLTFGPGATYLNYVTRGAIGGTWFAKLYGSFKATPWYKITLQALYIGDTTKHGNTVGNARTAAGRLRDDRTIGWEFDLINEINIYKQLKWDIYGGILLAGDALDLWTTVGNINTSPKNPWLIGTKLRYNF